MAKSVEEQTQLLRAWEERLKLKEEQLSVKEAKIKQYESDILQLEQLRNSRGKRISSIEDTFGIFELMICLNSTKFVNISSHQCLNFTNLIHE